MDAAPAPKSDLALSSPPLFRHSGPQAAAPLAAEADGGEDWVGYESALPWAVLGHAHAAPQAD